MNARQQLEKIVPAVAGTKLPEAAKTAPEESTHIVLAQHGINTGRSHITWPERFEAHVGHADVDLHVVTDQYATGPFPRWNMFVKNRRLGKAQAAILEHWVHSGSDRSRISLVGHSNGCDVIRHTAVQLVKRGIQIDAVILLAAPLNPAIPWLMPHVESGYIKRVISWATPNDYVLHAPGSVLGRLVRWPYGNMGRVGLKTTGAVVTAYQAPPFGVSQYTRWHSFGHTDYFNRANEIATFNTLIKEIEA